MPPGALDAPAVDTEALFGKLAVAVKSQLHKRVVKVADEIERILPGDEDALRCKAIALVQLGDFNEALQLLSKPPLSQIATFEKAYSLYRLGKIEEGLEVLHNALPASESAAALLELEAQLQYRLGNNQECIQLYDRLFQEHKAETTELKSNVLAAYVAANLAQEIPQLMAAMNLTSKASFEVAFNKACGLIESGEYAAAEIELRLAQKQGRETLFEEDCTEEEVQEELAPLTVQLAFLLGRLGRMHEAQEQYDVVLRGSGEPVGDLPTRAVATNNLVADTGRADGTQQNRKFVASSTKKFEAFQDRASGILRLVPALETRLSPAQHRVLNLNRALLYLAAGRLDDTKEVAVALARSPACAGWDQLVLLQAALLVREGKAQQADKVLEEFVGKHPAAARRPALLRVQLALEGGHLAAALALLGAAVRSDPQMASSGAVLATRVALHEQLGDVVGAEALLDSSLAYWQQRPRGDPAAAAATSWCLQALVSLKVKVGKLQEATKLYSQLCAAGVQSSAATQQTTLTLHPLLARQAFVRLTRAVAASDAAAAPTLAKELGSAPDTQGLELERLEDLARGASSLAAGGATAAATAASSGRKLDTYAGRKRETDNMDVDAQPKAKKPRKKRKPRLPAGFDVTKGPNGGLPLPDPQRWLAKWQRNDIKKTSKKRRDGNAVKGSQGAGKVDEALDRGMSGPEPAKADTGKTAAKGLPPLKSGGSGGKGKGKGKK